MADNTTLTGLSQENKDSLLMLKQNTIEARMSALEQGGAPLITLVQPVSAASDREQDSSGDMPSRVSSIEKRIQVMAHSCQEIERLMREV